MKKAVGLRHPGHNQVARVMTEYGLHAVSRRKNTYRVAEKKGELPDGTVLENILDRQFDQKQPHKVFTTDVTYIPTKGSKWLYLAVLIDLGLRQIADCKMSLVQDSAFAIELLNYLDRYSVAGTLMHSDQGNIYTSWVYIKRAKELNVTLSFSRRANCWDNAPTESWNGILKKEWMYHPNYRRDKDLLTPEELIPEIYKYIRYYNDVRPQKHLGYMTPNEYERILMEGAGEPSEVLK